MASRLGKLGRTGEDLVENIRVVQPDFNVPQLLTEHFRIDETTALEFSNKVNEAKVIITPDGTFALDSTTVKDVDSSGVSSINDLYFPRHQDTVVINMSMVRSVEDTLRLGSGLPDRRVGELALRSATIFELGRIITRDVYQLVLRNFHTSHMPVPASDTEGVRFFSDLSNELATIGLPIDWQEDRDYSSRLARIYNREVRPEQFFTRGGIQTLEAVIPSLSGEKLIANYRQRILSEQGVQALSEMGALFPMSKEEFGQICSYVLDPAEDVIISLRSR